MNYRTVAVGNGKRKFSDLENAIVINQTEQEYNNTCNNFSSGQNVEVIDNHIYFYCDVNTKNILELNKAIFTLNKTLVNFRKSSHIEYGINIENMIIYLHINSLGGYLTDAFSGVDTIINSDIPIYSIIEGYAASAATFLSVVCSKRFITKHSSVLIHQLSGGYWGTYQQMTDDMKNSTYLHKKIKNLYIEYCKGKMKKDKLDELLKRDIMLNFKKCKKIGLVDELI
jgi:ATP-dependent protease ClpP protease subunit